MATSDGGRTGGPCVTPDVVVDGFPQSSGADVVVATKPLHFRIKQEKID